MSIIAGLVLGSATVPPMTPPAIMAEQVMAAHRKATSIGPARCAAGADEEIVVCGRLTNPYATPLYRTDGERYDRPGTTAHAIESARQSFAPCRARADPCLKPLPIITMTGGKARIGQD